MKALVSTPICPLLRYPTRQCELVDEALYGSTVEILEAVREGWYLVKTGYRYTGYAPGECLLLGEGNVARWEALPKKVVLQAACDVLAGPEVELFCVATLVRGGLVAPCGTPDAKGWQKVSLCDGREGFLKTGFLGEHYTAPSSADEAVLRANVVATARTYRGTAYRWGGKTPMGIDCSGLTAMAYALNGITIHRDAQIKDGFPVHAIAPGALQSADLIFFPGHVALYVGDGRYLHATAFNGSDGVVYNSLLPTAPDYRQDLVEKITACGSIFPL